MSRPQLNDGVLGAQVRCSEQKMSTDSHKDANIKVNGDNNVTIKVKAGQSLKVTTRLFDVTDGKQEAVDGLVFVQRKDKDEVRFVVGFPKDGFYKFEIFGLDETKEDTSLPNLFNYLIEVTNCHKPASPFVKAYTKFYTDCCYLDEPKSLNESTPNLDSVKFDIVVPGAEKVSIHAGEEWFHLEKKGKKFEGKFDLSRWKGTNTKVTLNGCYEKNSLSYSVLLEYVI